MLFFHEAWNISLALAPWLFFGAVVSAVLHKLLPANFIQRQLTGYSGVIKGVFLGVPLPLCSCGVIPAGIGLRKDGASDGSSLAFLISTPPTGVDSILISAAFLGWPFAILKVVAATVTGIVGGCISEYNSSPSNMQTIPNTKSKKVTWNDAWQHGVQLIRSIWGWLFIGIVLSAAITTLLPQELFTSVSDGWLSILLALALSLPLYVCATASVPIAAALVAGGLPLQAALVFLMAGPASNLATIGAIYKTFGKQNTIIYLGTIIIGSIGFAVGFDFVLESASSSAHHEHKEPWQVPFAIILFGALLYFAWEDLRSNYARFRVPKQESNAQVVWVEGLHCGGCVQKLKTRLLQHDHIEEVEVKLEDGETKVYGTISNDALSDIILELDYTAFYPSLTFAITGINCGGCVRKLESALRTIDGVDTVMVNREPDIAHITGRLSKEMITAKIKELDLSGERVAHYGH